jgi:septum site-determining protein MinC
VVVTDGDVVILAPVNTGAEVLAAGNVHVYAPLRGRAMAGLLGDTTARIFTLALQAELVAIAGVYRAIEDDLPDNVRGRPAQVALEDDRLSITPLPSGDDLKRKRT